MHHVWHCQESQIGISLREEQLVSAIEYVEQSDSDRILIIKVDQNVVLL